MDSKPPPTPAPPEAGSGAEPVLNDLPATCPVCNEPREADGQFCQVCGHNFVGGADAAPSASTGLKGPLLWVIVAFWAVLAVIGMYWLYTSLYAI